MAEWAPKRFWKEAAVVEAEGGYTILLDGRALRTPSKASLILPSRAMAEVMAAEWQAQGEMILPDTMPFTRCANSAIDKITHQHADVAEMLAAFGETDLLCYRAERPLALVTRQAEIWQPVLDWAAERFGAPLVVTQGVLPVAQPSPSLAALKAEVVKLDRFQLVGFHDLVAISGSLLLALAVIHGHVTAEAAWEASRLDETFQNEQWGVDEEAAEAEAQKRVDFLNAYRFFTLARES